MAEQGEKTEATDQQTNGGDENGGGHKAVRAAAIAAATGATALAAKKAFSGRGESEDDEREQKPKRSRKPSSTDDSMLSEMLASGWDAAKDSLLPFAEDAAGAAGEWVARNSPEIVSETLVPRFIRSFERARKSRDDDDNGDAEKS